MKTPARVSTYDKGAKKFIKLTEKTTEDVLSFLKIKNRTVDIFFLTSQKMRALNATHKGKDRPTNILSFEPERSFVYAPESKVSLGEIYLCLPVLRSEVKKYEIKNVEYRIQELIVHGILHLIGYTHKGKRDIIEMQKKEQEILSKIHTL
jgi:rRNA maturation RNase YbeY